MLPLAPHMSMVHQIRTNWCSSNELVIKAGQITQSKINDADPLIITVDKDCDNL